MTTRITLSTPVTHTDWVWRFGKRIGYRHDSVRYILETCRAAGLKKLYWRCLDGGQACYRSRWVDPVSKGYEADNYHAWVTPGTKSLDFLKQRLRNFDSLAAAVEEGRKLGVKIHAWLTINEDDHAWGLASRFSRQHPQFRWVKRNGQAYNSQLSFAFSEVREYKLNIVREVLNYDIDGVFFDWMRTGDVRNGPQATDDGTADFGYEKPLVDAFRKKYHSDPFKIPNGDPRWVRFRAEPQTDFIREARRLIKAKDESLSISVMGHHPWSYRGDTPRINGNLHGLLLDIDTWTREGLFDEIVAAGYYRKGGTPEKTYRHLSRQVRSRCVPWLYCWLPPDPVEFKRSIQAAEKLGARQLLYWESDYVDLPERKRTRRELFKVMSAHTAAGS